MSSRPILLLVDDVPSNIAVLGEGLGADYEVRFATNGRDALKRVEEVLPDLILLDIEMPQMSGYEVCQELKSREATAGIPIIFLTARDQEADEEKGLRLGAVDYITKPFSLPIVRARVANHLELKARQEAMLSFLGIASHDLKTPLTIIVMSGAMIRRARSLDDARSYGDTVVDAGRRAKDLIDSYLAASAVKRGSLEVQPEEVELRPLVDEEIQFLRRALEPDQALTFVNQVNCPTVSADPPKLRQILANLISNAAKYSPAGGEISVEATRVGDEVCFKVSDQGVGISAEDKDRLFEQFRRVGDRNLAPGAGLGLWLTRALVQAHGGRIWVDSTPGAGSAFFFTLPAS